VTPLPEEHGPVGSRRDTATGTRPTRFGHQTATAAGQTPVLARFDDISRPTAPGAHAAQAMTWLGRSSRGLSHCSQAPRWPARAADPGPPCDRALISMRRGLACSATGTVRVRMPWSKLASSRPASRLSPRNSCRPKVPCGVSSELRERIETKHGHGLPPRHRRVVRIRCQAAGLPITSSTQPTRAAGGTAPTWRATSGPGAGPAGSGCPAHRSVRRPVAPHRR
jgi:hypothetical protein